MKPLLSQILILDVPNAIPKGETKLAQGVTPGAKTDAAAARLDLWQYTLSNNAKDFLSADEPREKARCSM